MFCKNLTVPVRTTYSKYFARGSFFERRNNTIDQPPLYLNSHAEMEMDFGYIIGLLGLAVGILFLLASGARTATYNSILYIRYILQ